MEITNCGPALLYSIFMLALITYDLTQSDKKAAIRNTIFLISGTALLWSLCRIGFDIAGWILLSIIPFFFVSLIALLVVTQLIKTDVNDDGNNNIITGKNLLSFIGYEDINKNKVYRPPGTGPFDIVAEPDPSPCDSVVPPLSPVKRIIGQLEKRVEQTGCCENTCN